MWLTEAGCEAPQPLRLAATVVFVACRQVACQKVHTVYDGSGRAVTQNEPVLKLQALGLAAGWQRRLDDALGLDIGIAACPVHALLQQRNVDVLEIHRARVALSAEHVARDVGGAGKVTEAANLPQSEAFGRTRRLSAVQLT